MTRTLHGSHIRVNALQSFYSRRYRKENQKNEVQDKEYVLVQASHCASTQRKEVYNAIAVASDTHRNIFTITQSYKIKKQSQ